MFNLFNKYSKAQRIKEKTEIIRAKAELMKAKAQLILKTPNKYEKIREEIDDLSDLKETLGSNDMNKWLKALDNPLVMQLVMKFLMSKGVDQNTTVTSALEKLKTK